MSAVTFAEYARCYDLLYRDKDYAAEARWVDGVLREGGRPVGTLLDVGCGTGMHAREFARLGWQVSGVDASSEMIALARERAGPEARVDFSAGRAADFNLERTFTAAVSLFHVASYHTAEGELQRMLANVRRHLRSGARFVFDFWHEPGVRADPPTRRERRVEGDQLRVHRIATPAHHPERHLVEVHYDVIVESPAGGPPRRIEELHRMRYFSVSEIVPYLTATGFTLERTHAGIGGAALDAAAWYGLIVATAC